MLRFHVNVFARPDQTVAREKIILRAQLVTPLGDDEGGPPRYVQTLPVTWEEATAALLAMPRMDAEPDGFFVVAGGEADGERWQVDGHLHEYQNKLHRVELRGGCPEQVFDTLLSALGWRAAEVVFELVQEGVTLDERDFRTWATS